MSMTLEHKGYLGSAEMDMVTGVLFGKLLFVNDLVTYEAMTVAELQHEFRAAVDDYLETCRQLGREPQQPCSGLFNVRVGPALHRAAAVRAQKDGVKLNAVVVSALEQYLSQVAIKHAHTHDHKVTVELKAPAESVGTGIYSKNNWITSEQFGTQAHVSH